MPTQVCPPLDRAPQAAASAAASRSASAATISASFPPHSATSGVRFWAQAAMTFFAAAADRRGQLARLEHDCVAGGQRVHDRTHRREHRVVPRPDDTDDAKRLVLQGSGLVEGY